jgi:hypothetical protein
MAVKFHFVESSNHPEQPMHAFIKTLAVAGIALCGVAQASQITFETAVSSDGPQASASDYRSVVNAAFTAPGANSTTVALYDNLSNQIVFSGSAMDIAFRSTIDFGVTAGQAGSWDLRVGVDFGNGGAVFLDGLALDYKSTDMWWAGSYADSTQSFQLPSVAIGAGNHTLQVFGLEHCCDGPQQAQFNMNGAGFTTFGSNDGLTAAVPEPETYALMLAGLAAIGATVRRRRAGHAA